VIHMLQHFFIAKKQFFSIILVGVIFAAVATTAMTPAHAQTEAAPSVQAPGAIPDLPADEYYRAVVLSLKHADAQLVPGETERLTTYTLKIGSGKENGNIVTSEVNETDQTLANRAFGVGDRVIVVKSYQFNGGPKYYLADNDRLRPLVLIALFFLLVAVVFGKMRGFSSVFGLATTIAIILYYVVPHIASGESPLRVSVMAAAAIATLSLYLAHGFNQRTTIALSGTVLTFALSTWFAIRSVSWSHLFGTGSEDAVFLQGMGSGAIDLHGLLLAGIMLGVLGILDDITTAQSAIVDELHRANPALRFRELYQRGLSVGREHIASLMNTLFLAYAGASLPLFLLFALNKGQPIWFIVNSETISEEIVRTLVGSVCLIFAVPITTLLAAAWYSRQKNGTHP